MLAPGVERRALLIGPFVALIDADDPGAAARRRGSRRLRSLRAEHRAFAAPSPSFGEGREGASPSTPLSSSSVVFAFEKPLKAPALPRKTNSSSSSAFSSALSVAMRCAELMIACACGGSGTM